jgi:putative DNA primase/helicase
VTAQLIPMPVDDPLSTVFLKANDIGNAERLVRLSKGLLRWVPELASWVAYDGKRWSVRDGERIATVYAHDVARHIDREQIALRKIADSPGALEAAFGFEVPPEVAKERVIALGKWAVKSGDASRTSAMLMQARSLLTAQLDEFDRDPLAFNVQNWTLRFVKAKDGGWIVKPSPHDPADMIMQMANVSYDPTADCPLWRKRMVLIQPDEDQRDFLQQRYGYFLTGLISEQKWFIDQGRGGDGKSVTNMAVGNLMGDYYRHASIETFLEGGTKSGSDHSSDLARLQGDIRFVSADEPKPQSTWNSSRLKQVTGGKITCRAMRKEEIEYVARWKLVVEINPFPKVASDDDGFWRRVHVTPWSYQFDKGREKSRPMEELLAEMAGENSGILNWMITGACKWLATRRLPMAAAADLALTNYRQSASSIGAWLIDRADRSDRDAVTKASVLYADFKAYCEQLGIDKAPSQTAFGNKLSAEQIYGKKDGAGNIVRLGIKLKPDGIGGGLGAAGERVSTPPPPPSQGGWAVDDGDDLP